MGLSEEYKKEMEEQGYYFEEPTEEERKNGCSGHLKKFQWKIQEDRVFYRVYSKMLDDKYEEIFSRLRK